jgi:hypothetical protein
MSTIDHSDEFRGEAERLAKLHDEVLTSFNITQERWWRELVGDRLTSMLGNSTEAMNLLLDTDPRIRSVAIQVLTYYWRPTTSLTQACEQFAINDPDPDVRTQAISSLGISYLRTNDYRIRQLLASIVADDKQPEAIRTVAYDSLLVVCGSSDPKFDACIKAQRPVRFPEDVNWSIVTESL